MSSRTHSNPSNVHAQELFQAQHISLAIDWQLLEGGALGDVLFPAAHGLVLHRHSAVGSERSGHVAQGLLAIHQVLCADLHLVHARQHVQLGEVDLRDSVHHRRVLQLRNVDPAASARATRRGSVLAAIGPQLLAHRVYQLTGKRALAHPSAVGLHDPSHVIDGLGRNAEPGADAADGGVGGGDVRIGAEVKIQH